jgi:hypothetical protein
VRRDAALASVAVTLTVRPVVLVAAVPVRVPLVVAAAFVAVPLAGGGVVDPGRLRLTGVTR